MRFNIRVSYNLDLLNLMNILTGEEFYAKRHEEAFARFGKPLSTNSRRRIEKVVDINGSAMIGPYLCLVASAIPNFEKRSLVRMFSDLDLLRNNFSQYRYFDPNEWPNQASIFGLLIPVVKELETKGFREYWRTNRLHLIERSRRMLSRFVHKFQLQGEIEFMLGPGQAPDRITLYLCSFASPHGIKVCGSRYIADISFPKEFIVSTAIHEMFHPPYDAESLRQELIALAADPLLKRAFETKDPKYGYSTMNGFIEENVVEAMALFISQKLGLEKDPLAYLASHDGGSHVLSVVLLEYFKRYPKPKKQPFHEYFRDLLKVLPIGSLDAEYEIIIGDGV